MSAAAHAQAPAGVRARPRAGVQAGVRTASKVVGYELRNLGRGRWLLAYAAFFLVVTDALLRFGGGGGRALLSLASVVLFVIPLVGLVFGATYLYDAREFTELLLAQPVGRGALFAGLYLGLALPLALAFAVGVGLPFLWHPGALVADAGATAAADASPLATLLVLGGCGVALTLVFVALAFVVATRAEDRVRGLGAAVGLWLLLALVYDGLVLLLVAVFADYPVERPVLALTLANPVDLARVLLLLRFDAGALLGYTGAVFTRFFAGPAGAAAASAALTLWVAGPVWLGWRAFRRKDF